MLKLFSAAFLLFSMQCLSTPTINPSDISLGGTGCPANSVDIKKTSLGEIKITFRGYQTTGQRKSCAISIPISVPHGFQVSLMQISVNGNINISKGVNGNFEVERFFAGQQGNIEKYQYMGPKKEKFSIESSNHGAWSRCGASGILRANTNIRLINSKSSDKLDVESFTISKLKWREC
jgi:hypothetical protein